MKIVQTLVACVNALFSPAVHSPAVVAQNASPAEIVIVVGTDRPDSNTSRVAQELFESYSDKGLSVHLFTPADFGAHFYDSSIYAQRPDDFKSFNDAVLAANLVVLVTPEYNATVPAPLTRTINLLSFPDSFQDKKFAIVSVSVSPYGAARAHEQLKKTLVDLHCIVHDDVNLKIAHVDTQTKSVSVYADHADKIAAFAQE